MLTTRMRVEQIVGATQSRVYWRVIGLESAVFAAGHMRCYRCVEEENQSAADKLRFAEGFLAERSVKLKVGQKEKEHMLSAAMEPVTATALEMARQG